MKVALLGDIALIGQYDITKNSSAKDRLKVIAERLKEFDYVIANLESPLTDKSRTMVCKSMHLKTSKVNVELLKYLHVNAVSLSNNHLFDYGEQGLNDTIATLEQYGIEWFGANSKQLIKEIGTERICFSGFCCYSTNGTGYMDGTMKKGINTLTYNNVMNQIEVDRSNGAFSFLSFHWGDEHTNYPKYEHVCLAEAIAKKKDVVICGHHPHIIQGVQKLNNSLVAYSLGNCLFDDCVSITGSLVLKQNLNNKKSFIFEVNIENATVDSYKYHGFKDEKDGPVFFDINDEIEQISKPLKQINNINDYETMRRIQISKVVLEKFGKHDFKWLLSRLNYYSVGAYLTAKVRKKKYLKEKEYFSGGKYL